MLQLEDEVDHVLAHRGPVQFVQEPTAFEPEREIQCFNKQKVVKKNKISAGRVASSKFALYVLLHHRACQQRDQLFLFLPVLSFKYIKTTRMT